ncbi:hypothetical protein A9Q95_12580 [Rhodobacterales bacterium 59_46_T64]|nr:hypothetical protein A9Q95_12580 [Rhodobacterales bacterium 59_46_T64]
MSFKFSEDQKASLLRGLKVLDAGPDEWVGYEVSPWSKLRSVLETKAVKIVSIWLVFIPILLTFTSEFPERYSATPFGGNEEIPFVLQIPFNWYFLYFSAACFGVGRLIYVVFCPEFIQKYGSSASATSDGVTAELVKNYASDYLSSNKVKNPLSPEGARLNIFLNEITGENNLVGQHWDDETGKNLIQAKVEGSHIREIPGTGTYLRAFKLTGQEDEDQKRLTSILLWMFIDWLNHSKTTARLLCVVLVFCGFVLLMIPLLQGFYTVVIAFAGRGL